MYWGILASQDRAGLRTPCCSLLPPQPFATRAMDPLVHFQSILALEAFATLRAGEGPAVRVNAQPVTEEQGRVGEAEAAVGAGVGLLSRVRLWIFSREV